MHPNELVHTLHASLSHIIRWCIHLHASLLHPNTHKNLRVNLSLNDTIARFVDLSSNDAQSRVKPFLWLNSHFKYTQSRVLLANPRTLLPCFQGLYTRLRAVWSQIKNARSRVVFTRKFLWVNALLHASARHTVVPYYTATYTFTP